MPSSSSFQANVVAPPKSHPPQKKLERTVRFSTAHRKTILGGWLSPLCSSCLILLIVMYFFCYIEIKNKYDFRLSHHETISYESWERYVLYTNTRTPFGATLALWVYSSRKRHRSGRINGNRKLITCHPAKIKQADEYSTFTLINQIVETLKSSKLMS